MTEIRDTILYCVVGFKNAKEMATFYKDDYKNIENARITAKESISDGYEMVYIRKEDISIRNEFTEISSSGVIETYTQKGVVQKWYDTKSSMEAERLG